MFNQSHSLHHQLLSTCLCLCIDLIRGGGIGNEKFHAQFSDAIRVIALLSQAVNMYLYY